jgi:glycosyltransferase involved in cell wall biosynthesis
MKIVHILHQYLPEKVGGTELYTRTLARRQVAAGHTVSIFTPAVSQANWPEPAVEDGVHVYRLAVGPRSPSAVFLDTFRQPALGDAFSQLLAQTQPDLVHLQHLMGLPAALSDQLLAARVPFIITLHDYWYLCANAQLLTNYDNTICSGPGQWFLNCAHCAIARAGQPKLAFLRPAVAPIMTLRNHRLKDVLNRAAGIIAPTDFVRRIYNTLGIKTDKITVIPHGFVPPAAPVFHKTDPGTLQIAFIGGLAWQKGVHVLIEAVNGLPVEGVKLTIYGDKHTFPDYVVELQSLVRHPGIHIAGRLPHEALWTALAESDVVVVPSLWYEVAPLIIQEAFAAGVPVIASNTGALQEQIRHGIDGYLFQTGDSASLAHILADLQQNPSKLAQLRKEIQPVYTIDRHLQAVETVYWLALETTPDYNRQSYDIAN